MGVGARGGADRAQGAVGDREGEVADQHRKGGVGLSLGQWDILRHVRTAPEASLHRLAELTFQTDQSMGELAKRTSDRDLVERAPGPGRAVHHRLTAQGERTRQDGDGIFRAVLAESVGRLTGSERDTLHALLLKAGSTD